MMVDTVEISKHESLWRIVNHVPHRCSFVHCCNIADSHLWKLNVEAEKHLDMELQFQR